MKWTRSRSARAGTPRRRRIVIAAGAALLLSSASLALGPAVPAGADHGEGANTGVLNTPTWRVCALGWEPPSLPAVAVNHGISAWNAHAELTVTRSCTDYNVYLLAASFPDTWWGSTTCPSGRDASGDCIWKRVELNLRTINMAEDPDHLWRTTACHELGHVGGLAHRTTTASCMVTGSMALSAAIRPDRHDNDAIAATYPR